MSFVKVTFVSLAALVARALCEVGVPGVCEEGSGACDADIGVTDEVSQLQVQKTRPSQPASWVLGVSADIKTVQSSNFALTGESVPKWDCPRCSGDDCDIDTMKQGECHNVYPGGETGCLSGSEFFFTVFKGSSSKLHIHFQGGGACWDSISFAVKSCTQVAEQVAAAGAFNTSNPSNPWHSYSFIIINFCSGDAFSGHAERRWNFRDVNIRGADNAKASLDYGLRNFPNLAKLTVSGSSAGSLGVQFWARTILDTFTAKDSLVVADSFIGVLYPEGKVLTSEGYLFKAWNSCSPLFMTTDEMAQCHQRQLLLSDLFLSAMKKHPATRFAAIDSKADAVQISFERLFEASILSILGALMSAGEFYKYGSLQLIQWYEKQSNFYTYLVPGEKHTFLPGGGQRFKALGNVDTATPAGPDGGDLRPTMLAWLSQLEATAGSALRTVCAGENLLLTSSTTVGRNEVDYCAKRLAGVQSP